MKPCNRTLEYDSGVGVNYYKCDKKPFKEVQYKSSFNSEIVNECLCKTHYNALIKNINRISKKTRFDFELKTL